MIKAGPYSSVNLQRRVVKLRRLSATGLERLRRVQTMRLWTVGAFFLALGIGSARPSLKLELVAVPVFFILFPIQVKITRNRRRFWQSLESLILFLERQNLRMSGQAGHRATAAVAGARGASAVVRDYEPEDGVRETPGLATMMHTQIRDLGVFGPHSLFTLIDETFTAHGKRELLTWMTPAPRPTPEILARQEQVRALRSESWFFTRLTLIADQARSESVDLARLKTDELTEFIKSPFFAVGLSPQLHDHVRALDHNVLRFGTVELGPRTIAGARHGDLCGLQFLGAR